MELIDDSSKGMGGMGESLGMPGQPVGSTMNPGDRPLHERDSQANTGTQPAPANDWMFGSAQGPDTSDPAPDDGLAEEQTEQEVSVDVEMDMKLEQSDGGIYDAPENSDTQASGLLDTDQNTETDMQDDTQAETDGEAIQNDEAIQAVCEPSAQQPTISVSESSAQQPTFNAFSGNTIESSQGQTWHISSPAPDIPQNTTVIPEIKTDFGNKTVQPKETFMAKKDTNGRDEEYWLEIIDANPQLNYYQAELLLLICTGKDLQRAEKLLKRFREHAGQ